MKKIVLGAVLLLTLCAGAARADLIRPGETPWWKGLERLSEEEKLKECQELKKAHPNIENEHSVLPTKKKWNILGCEERLKEQATQRAEMPLPQETTPSVLPPGVVPPAVAAPTDPNAVLARCIELKEKIDYMETAETGVGAPQILIDLRNEYNALNCAEVVNNPNSSAADNSTSQAEPSRISSLPYGVAGFFVLFISGVAFILLWRTRKPNLPRAL